MAQPLLLTLGRLNPWWLTGRPPTVPEWKRFCFQELEPWLGALPPSRRATILLGARQVGKTTLLLQSIRQLLFSGVPGANILYASFDHGQIRNAGLEELMQTWELNVPIHPDHPRFLFLDEIQRAEEWQLWTKRQVDAQTGLRIFLTGSALAIADEQRESAAGRIHTIRIPTLSFGETLRLKRVEVQEIPSIKSLADLSGWDPAEFQRVSLFVPALERHFRDYLVRGGFPELVLIQDEEVARRHLREDVLHRVLSRDMTDLYGIRNVSQLENLLLYVASNEGGTADLTAIASNIGADKNTVQRYLDVLERANLIYLLRPYGYGKEILRGRRKVYLADPGIAECLLLRGRELLTDSAALGFTVEAAVYRHLLGAYDLEGIEFSYWHSAKGNEVDVIASMGRRVVAFEVKYARDSSPARLEGLGAFLKEKKPDAAYVITREPDQFGPQQLEGTMIMRVPAALACWWLSHVGGRARPAARD